MLSLLANGFGLGSFLAGVITMILGGLSFAAGMRLRKNSLSGYHLTFLSLGLQAISLSSAVLTWNYTAVMRVAVYVGEPFEFGFNFPLSPGVYMSFNRSEAFRVSFDLFALTMIVLLFVSSEHSKAKAANKMIKQDAQTRDA